MYGGGRTEKNVIKGEEWKEQESEILKKEGYFE